MINGERKKMIITKNRERKRDKRAVRTRKKNKRLKKLFDISWKQKDLLSLGYLVLSYLLEDFIIY